MADEGSAAAPEVPLRRRRRRRRSWVRRSLLLAGVAMIAGGIYLITVPLIGVWQRGRADQSALTQWNSGGSATLVGPAVGPAADAADRPRTCAAGSGASDLYALVSFPSLPQYGYRGVAGDGTWDMLLHRSMVHYHGTAAPGQKGNDVIAFHREPHFEHIDQLKAGDEVDIQDRSCVVYRYRITGRWVLPPNKVTQLNPTGGYDLTLVTCTPWFRDYDRIVWRASLLG